MFQKHKERHVYAGFWVRFGSQAIDVLLLNAVILPAMALIYGKEWFIVNFDPNVPYTILGPADFIFNYLSWFVATVLFLRIKGATPGKMFNSLKVIDAETGGQLSTGQCVGRFFAFFISILPLGLGLLWVVFDKKKQAWHDKLAGTVVVRVNKEGTVGAGGKQTSSSKKLDAGGHLSRAFDEKNDAQNFSDVVDNSTEAVPFEIVTSEGGESPSIAVIDETRNNPWFVLKQAEESNSLMIEGGSDSGAKIQDDGKWINIANPIPVTLDTVIAFGGNKMTIRELISSRAAAFSFYEKKMKPDALSTRNQIKRNPETGEIIN